MAEYVEAPNYTEYLGEGINSLFLAGGITGCWDWQATLFDKIRFIPKLTVYNPRRTNYPIDDIESIRAQIKWEFYYLKMCDAVSFWFASETVQPITLLEFGRWTGLRKKIFVGCHPDYLRKQDLEIQLELVDNEVTIHSTLDSLATEVKDHFRYLQ